MKQLKFSIRSILILKLILFSFFLMGTVLLVDAQAAVKKIDTWYVYKEGKSSFKDLEPFKDMLGSISVFGKPSKSFMDECHQNNIQVYQGVSGKENSIDTPEKIKVMVEKYLDDCNTVGYDGIDLDYEALSPEVRDMYSIFLKELSAALHKSGKKLSQCVGFYDNLYQGKQDKMFYDVEVVASTCDLVRVMCYDMYFAAGRSDKSLMHRDDCQGIGATSTYPFVKEAMAFWAKYVPKEKLVMGLPAYSNDYEMAIGGKGEQVYGAVPVNSQGTLQPPTWLWFEKVNLYVYKDANNCVHLFYASDAKSTQALLDLGTELKIKNIGFWHFSTVTPEMWSVARKWIEQSN